MPGSFYLLLEGERAPVPLHIEYVRVDDNGSVVDEFEKGELVESNRTTASGEHRVRVNGVQCPGTFVVEPELETDLLLTLATGTCRLATTGRHAADVAVHPPRVAVLAGIAPILSTIRATLMDGGRAPLSTDVDESGHFSFNGLAPGTYRVEVVRDGETLRTIEVRLEPGADAFLDLL